MSRHKSSKHEKKLPGTMHRSSELLPAIQTDGERQITQSNGERSAYITEAHCNSPSKDLSSAVLPSGKQSLSKETVHYPQQQQQQQLSNPLPPPLPPPPPPSLPPPGPPLQPPPPPGSTIPQPPAMAASLPIVPHPPPIAKLHTDGTKVHSSRTALSVGHEKLTDEYMRNWVVVEEDLDRCIQDVQYVVDTLKAVKSVVIEQAMEYAPFFGLLHRAVTARDATRSTKCKILAVMLDRGFVDFVKEYFNILVEQCLNDRTTWELKFVKISCLNLVKTLEMVRHAIRYTSSQLALKMYDQFYETIRGYLNHNVFVDFIKNTILSNVFKIMSSLLLIFQDFSLMPEIRKERFNETVRTEMESVLRVYVRYLKDSSLTIICKRTLCFLAGDESPFPQLPLNYLQNTHASDANLNSFIENAVYVVKRLVSVSLEAHLKYPWIYQYDFCFMMKCTPGSKDTRCSLDSQNKLYEAIVSGGDWHQLVISLYLAALTKLDIDGYDRDYLDCALMNAYNGLLTVANGTDVCRNPEVLQRIFDSFFEPFFEQLSSERIVKALKFNDGGNILTCIGNCMMTIVHNFSFYYEPSIPVMREKGMMAVARHIREECADSEIKTSSLLIIAYLLTESDDKQMMKMTDDELSYLIGELQKSLLSTSASDYHPDELIDGLNRIAVSDMNKLKLIENKILPLLVKSLSPKKYPPNIQAAAAKAIWNLAFTDESKQEIINEKGCVAALESLKNSEHKEVRAAVAGALWQLKGKEQHVEDVVNSQHSKTDDMHIMMSYNHQAKRQVFAMKDKLQGIGYKVWIDEEQITAGGSTLEAMSTAIEQSCLVLIFFSEAYKNSVNCRAEAEYVFERRKPFLPIQVQPKYTPEGWLGILFGSKYRFTLCKPDRYEAEMAGLLAKVQEVTGDQPPLRPANDVPDAPARVPVTHNPIMPEVASSALHKTADLECTSWTCEEVSAWLGENGLGAFKDSLLEMDGGMLTELAALSYHHKDTFYTLISKAAGMDLVGALKFGKACSKLLKTGQ